MENQQRLTKNIQRHIKGSEKPITIMFTDIEASARYWDARGDIVGRLMIDRLNRLMLPVIRKNRGKIVKTIGDALMVSYKHPVHSVKAAIAIQQLLQRERKTNPKLPRVRIGIHTGRAIVEKNDVFGDMVNVASRVENRAKGGEVLLSARTVRKMSQKEYFLVKKERFTPKGKKKPMTLYKCNWRKAPSMIDHFKFGTLMQMKSLQKIELAVAAVSTLVLLVLLYLRYVRYLLADTQTLALLTLNPVRTILDRPLVAMIFPFLFALIYFVGRKLKKRMLVCYKFIHGGMFGLIGFLLLYLPTTLFSFHIGLNSDKVLYSSKHLFVEVVDTEAPVLEEPDKHASEIKTVPMGMLMLLADVREHSGLTWNKVLIGRRIYGWVQRVEPPKMGVPARRITMANKFYFRLGDLYTLILCLLGFVWGFLRFKLRPT